MKYPFLFSLLCILAAGGIQAQDFKIYKQKSSKSITYIAHNPTDDDVYVTMRFSGYGFRANRPSGEEQLVPAQTDSLVLAVLTFEPGKKRSVGARYNLRKVRKSPPPQAPLAEETPIPPPPAPPAPPKPDPFAKGVHLFTKPGCSRCSWAKGDLDKRGVAYSHYDTSQSKDNQLMWQQLSKKSDFKGGRITLPVIIIDGKAHYSIKSLGRFLENIE